jgi:hypothetical protein
MLLCQDICAKLSNRLLQHFCAATGDHNSRAGRSQTLSHRESETGSTAGYDCESILE